MDYVEKNGRPYFCLRVKKNIRLKNCQPFNFSINFRIARGLFSILACSLAFHAITLERSILMKIAILK